MVKINETLIVILLFLLITFITAHVILTDIWLPINGGDYNFRNFIIYNYFIKIIGYTLKISLLYVFFKFLFFAFNIDKKISLLKILTVSEIIYLIATKGYLLSNLYFTDTKITKDFKSNYESNASLIKFFQGTDNIFQYLISFITVFDLIYIICLVYFLAEDLHLKFFKSFKLFGCSYISLLFIIALIKTLLTL